MMGKFLDTLLFLVLLFSGIALIRIVMYYLTNVLLPYTN